MNKSASRELAFKLLYSIEMQKEYNGEQFELFCKANEIEDKKTKEYMREIVKQVNNNKEDIPNIETKTQTSKNISSQEIKKLPVTGM